MSLGTRPSDVRITIVADPAARVLKRRITGVLTRAGMAAGLPIAVLAAAAGALAGAPGGDHGSSIPGARGVAAAYGYPPRCLAVTIPGEDPTYARADFDRSSRCGRYDGDATAIFHRVDGAWRSVVDAVSYSCPVGSLPRRVQLELGVCL